MGARSSSGYELRKSLGSGFYGELFSGVDAAGTELRVLEVAARLTSVDGYTAALARYGSDLTGLSGPGVLPTHSVGRQLDGSVTVVTAGIGPAASIEGALASARGQRMPYPIALRVVRGLAQGLAAAHREGIVHGAPHPRSILIDEAGEVWVDHFAVARALASMAAVSDDPELLSGFGGYLAPELALAEEPTPASDVYAAGVIMYSFFGGDAEAGGKAGRLAATTSIRRLVVRAMDTDVDRRFDNAVDLARALEAAIESDRCEVARGEELALYADDCREAHHPAPVVDAAEDGGGLDDLLDELDDPGVDGDREPTGVTDPPSDGAEEEPTALAPRRTPAPSEQRVGDVLESLESELTQPGQSSLIDDPDTRVEEAESEMVSMVDEIGENSQLTQVDDLFAIQRDPISELIELERPPSRDDLSGSRLRLDGGEDDEHTPLPPPQVHDSGSFTKEAHDIARRKRGGRSVQQRAEDAISALDAEQGKGKAVPIRVAAPRADETDFLEKRRLPGWFYGVLTLGALGVMFLLVWTRTDVFHPERAERKRKAREAERAAKEAELRAKQARGGEIIVSSDQEGAAVWLRLGRTPLESMPLPLYHPHQLRLELDGYRHEDVVVTSSHWTGDRATVAQSLEPAAAGHVIPAWPPPIPEIAKGGFTASSGLGVIQVESTPAQAEVWLLVGYTNGVHMRDFEAGKRYEFKLTKDGFRPGFTVVEADEWKAGGADPELLRDTVIERVGLEPLAR